MQDRIGYLKQLLYETKEQQRLLEEEGYEAGETEEGDTAAETETENEREGGRWGVRSEEVSHWTALDRQIFLNF